VGIVHCDSPARRVGQAAAVTVVLEGFHAVKHALRFAPELVTSITVGSVAAALALADELAPDIRDLIAARAVEGSVQHPTRVAGTAERTPEDRSVLMRRSTPLVLLDDPRHPGNAGAAIRVAAAAGASGVAFLGALDPWHPAVLRGAAGLHYALPVLTCALVELHGPILALDADGDELGDIPSDAILVVGSERAGLSAEVRQSATRVVSLPMRTGVSSLNLATAVSAALYAWRLSPRGAASHAPEAAGSAE
jgi:TrmH family RNA methyltransferase